MGKHAILASTPGSDLRESLHIMLDEMLKALEESFCGLTDEQLWFEGIEGRNRIGSILMHDDLVARAGDAPGL